MGNICCPVDSDGDHDQDRKRNENKWRFPLHKSDSVPEPAVPICPICGIDEEEYINLRGCNHDICKLCFKEYLKTDIKNINKYPFKCFQYQCDQIIDIRDIKYALDVSAETMPTITAADHNHNHNHNAHINVMMVEEEKKQEHKQEEELKEVDEIKEETNQELFAIFEKFSVMCAIPGDQRDECPQCKSVFFLPSHAQPQPSWSSQKQKKQKKEDHNYKTPGNARDSISNQFTWIASKQRGTCYQCQSKFKFIFNPKHNCRQCGEVFCEKCCNYQLLLSVTSPEMQAFFVKYKTDKYDNGKVQKAMTLIQTQAQTRTWAPTQNNANTNPNTLALAENDDSNDNDESDVLLSDHSHAKVVPSLLSSENKELLESTFVRSCFNCWVTYYRAICSECDFEFCMQCRKAWHPSFDCVQQKQMRTKLKSSQNKKARQQLELADKQRILHAKQTEKLMLSQNYRQCPGCHVFVEKNEGCNHMTHNKCPNPSEADHQQTHFCYCCSEQLYGVGHKYEENGTVHFANGVFADCRKANQVTEQRRAYLRDLDTVILKKEKSIEKYKQSAEKETQCIVM